MPQVDGPLDLSTPNGPNIQEANYCLNKNKQVTGIQNDATLIDYDVELNNFEENATIKCSSGFYAQVAKPFFASLAK